MFLAIGNMLAKLFGKNLDFFGRALSRAGASKLATWTYLTGIIAVLYTAVNAIIMGIVQSLPHVLAAPMTWVVPTNTNELLTAYVAFRVALAIYHWKKTWISGGSSTRVY